jgi:hypothetical protein
MANLEENKKQFFHSENVKDEVQVGVCKNPYRKACFITSIIYNLL